MARRTKKITKSRSKGVAVKPVEDWKIFSGTSFRLTKSRKTGAEKSFRFNLSLIILMAVLEASLFIFLLTLIGAQTAQGDSRKSFSSAPVAVGAKKFTKPASQKLNDPSLDFELTVPPQLRNWLYKTGDIKSPVDDELSDQYLQMYLPVEGKKNSRNFNEMTEAILTIKKFTTDEWEKLEKGCQKNNTLFCDAAGTKIIEKDGSVYAYEKNSNCPSGMESKCALADKIVSGFQLK